MSPTREEAEASTFDPQEVTVALPSKGTALNVLPDTLPPIEDLLRRGVTVVLRPTQYPPGPPRARQAGSVGQGGITRVGRLELDAAKRDVRVNGKSLQLTALDFSLLALLASDTGRVWSFEELRREVWRDICPAAGDTTAVRSAVQRLRKKLSETNPGFRIETLRGHGFRISLGQD